MATKVIHIKDAPAGWEKDPAFVYIGRGKGSSWDNPFTVQEYGQGNACDAHAEWFPRQEKLVARLGELKDKTLVCFCRKRENPKRCHGDLLARLADRVK